MQERLLSAHTEKRFLHVFFRDFGCFLLIIIIVHLFIIAQLSINSPPAEKEGVNVYQGRHEVSAPQIHLVL